MKHVVRSGVIAIILSAIGCTTTSSSDSLRSPWEFPPVEELPVLDGMSDPFVKPDGSRVISTREWPAQRAYLKAMLKHYLYGSMPPRPKQFDLKRLSGKPAFDGKAIHERYLITLNRNQKSATVHFELRKPAADFVGLKQFGRPLLLPVVFPQNFV